MSKNTNNKSCPLPSADTAAQISQVPPVPPVPAPQAPYSTITYFADGIKSSAIIPVCPVCKKKMNFHIGSTGRSPKLTLYHCHFRISSSGIDSLVHNWRIMAAAADPHQQDFTQAITARQAAADLRCTPTGARQLLVTYGIPHRLVPASLGGKELQFSLYHFNNFLNHYAPRMNAIPTGWVGIKYVCAKLDIKRSRVWKLARLGLLTERKIRVPSANGQGNRIRVIYLQRQVDFYQPQFNLTAKQLNLPL